MNEASALPAAVERLLQQYPNPADHGGWVVAVSGGVDSMVLLHVCARLAQRQNQQVLAVHVNHGLRPTAERDQNIVQGACANWNVPCEIVHIDISEIPSRMSKGVEADARRLRYEGIADVARRHALQSVLLGHHADDQLETIVWRLVRGTSGTGVAGMRKASTRHGMLWLRPLLGFEKSELQSYASENGVPFVEDESNRDTAYTRNYIRHEIIPHLKTLNPGCASSAARMAEIIQTEDAWLDNQAACVIEQAAERCSQGFRISLPRLHAAALPLQRRAIKILLYCLTSADWSYSHIESVLRLGASAVPSSSVKLPSNISAWREYDSLYIGHAAERQTDQTSEVQWVLEAGSSNEISGTGQGSSWKFFCFAWTPGQGVRAQSLYELRIPRLDTVTVRTARTGERVKLLWSGSKKIQDVYTDSKVPKRLRESWPVFEAAGEIIWLPGLLRSRCSLLEPDANSGWIVQARHIDAEGHRN